MPEPAPERPPSIAGTRDIVCDACGHPYRVDVPLIIEVDRAPDLLERLAGGVLYRAACPACGGDFGELDAPCVLLGLGRAAPLIVSPPRTTSAEDNRDLFVQLVLATQEWLAEDWDSSLIDKAISVYRDLLVAVLAGSRPGDPRAAAAAPVLAFIHAPWGDRRRLIADEPALLEADAGTLLEAAITSAEAAGSTVAAEDLRAELDVLRRCRQQGVDPVIPADLEATLAELEAGPEPGRQVELARLALDQAGAEGGGDGGDRLLREQLVEVLAGALIDDPTGNRAQRIEEAIELLADPKTFTWRTKEVFPEAWARRQLALGVAYLNRPLGERGHNVERALVHLGQAADVFDRQETPEEWAHAQLLLAGALVDRDVEQALDHGRAALEVLGPERAPLPWSEAHRTMARALLRLPTGDRAANVQAALDHLETVAAAGDALPVDVRAGVQLDLATTYLEAATDAGDGNGAERDRLDRAVAVAEAARATLTEARRTALAATADHLLGMALAERFRRGGGTAGAAADAAAAAAAFARALTVRTDDRSAVDSWDTQDELARLHFDQDQWGDALAVYRSAVQAGETMLADAYTEGGRLEAATRLAPAYARAAYCLLQLGQRDEALQWLEGGRARLLGETLNVDDADLSALDADRRQEIVEARQAERMLEAELRAPSGAENRAADDVLAERLRSQRRRVIRLLHSALADHPEIGGGLRSPRQLLAGVPAGGAAVLPFFTSRGSALLVLPHGTETIGEDHVLPSDGRDQDWRDVTSLWVDACQRWEEGGSRQQWMNVVDILTGELWGLFGAALTDRLDALGVAPGAAVVIVPHATLGVLPVHAAWRMVGGARRALLDDYVVSFAPSLTVLAAAQRRRLRNEGRERSALFVANPTGDLPFTEEEAAVGAARFAAGHRRVLVGAEATAAAVVEAGRAATHLHFACHGVHDWRDPMQSGLVLHGEQVLTLAEITSRLDLAGAQLVVLSACDSGLSDVARSPEEHVGLPAGFLMAGACTVVSTLWPVGDLSSMLLVERFYEMLLAGLHPADALRRAQLWLRDVLAAEVAERLRPQGGTGPARTLWRQLAALPPGERPFEHPVHWAAFTCTGA